MNTRFKEGNILKLIQNINASKLVFIDRKVNRDFRDNYKDIIYKLGTTHYKYSDYDNNGRYKGEKVHIFGYKDLYIKVKLTSNTCKILSMHIAKYAL